MQVQMKTTLCGPNGSLFPGRIAEMAPKQAKDLIAGGYAVPASAKASAGRPAGAQAANVDADQAGVALDAGAAR